MELFDIRCDLFFGGMGQVIETDIPIEDIEEKLSKCVGDEYETYYTVKQGDAKEKMYFTTSF